MEAVALNILPGSPSPSEGDTLDPTTCESHTHTCATCCAQRCAVASETPALSLGFPLARVWKQETHYSTRETSPVGSGDT